MNNYPKIQNPKLKIHGTKCPDNFYVILTRDIVMEELDQANVLVKIQLVPYIIKQETHEVEVTDKETGEVTTVEEVVNVEYKVNSSVKNFRLKNLPNDSTVLGPRLYQTALINQHGDKIVDGTALKDFIVLS